MNFFSEYFINNIKNNYLNFNGRARRKEYWMYVACYTGIYVVLMILTIIFSAISNGLGSVFSILTMLVNLALVIPTIAVGVRRMHDVNKDWWYILIPVYNIILAIQEGDKGDNQYGPDPKAGEQA